jgi:rod shape-determining protein MreC
MKLTTERLLAITLVIIIIIALIIPKKYFWNPVKGAFSVVTTPVQKVLYGGSHSVFDFFSTVGHISQLAKENNQLKDEVNKSLTDEAKLQDLENENSILRDQLNFQKQNNFKLVTGNIIAHDPTNIQNSLTIDVGSNQGVKVDMPVISSGMLVGKISEVRLTSSQVLLITNPNSIINAMISESQENGLVQGQLGNGLMMNSIPQNTKINVGDLVVTSGLGGTFPKGLVIGQVSEIVSKQGEIFQSANLQSNLDINKLQILFVITGVS